MEESVTPDVHEQRGWMAFAPQLILAAQVMVILLAVGYWWASRAAAPQPLNEPWPTPDPAMTRPVTLESAYPIADGRAEEWEANAQLVNVSMQVDWPAEGDNGVPLRVAPGGWVTFVYVAPWKAWFNVDGTQTLTLLFERNSGAIVDERVVKSSVGESALALKDMTYLISSTDAILVAESAIGASYRAECPAYRSATKVSLDVRTAEEPSWFVSYQDARHTERNDVEVRVATVSGELMVDRKPAEPCPAV